MRSQLSVDVAEVWVRSMSPAEGVKLAATQGARAPGRVNPSVLLRRLWVTGGRFGALSVVT